MRGLVAGVGIGLKVEASQNITTGKNYESPQLFSMCTVSEHDEQFCVRKRLCISKIKRLLIFLKKLLISGFESNCKFF